MEKYSKYWNKYYEKNTSPNFPSNFAKFCKKKLLNSNFKILEIGCGNGRDSIYFSKYVKHVTCLDKSKNAIKIIDDLKKENQINNLVNLTGDVKQIKNILQNNKFNLIYMRWFLHSINLQKENYIFQLLSEIKIKKPIIAIEARSSKDNIINNNNTKKITNLELVSNGNHYRRLLDKQKFFEKLRMHGFKIIYQKESRYFSNLKIKNSNINPSLIRLFIK